MNSARTPVPPANTQCLGSGALGGWYHLAVVIEERLGWPQHFVERLARHLESVAEPGLPLPTDAQLAALVEVIFFASLHEDEARRTEFSIAWETRARDCAAVVAMATPVRVTPTNLARLAPATRHEVTSIAVRADGDELVAWALLERNTSARPSLTIRALAPGVLRVEYAGVPRALYARGNTLLLGGASEITSPARVLTSTFAAWADGADPVVGIDLRAAVVTRIASRALDHGHGGMILVIPAELPAPVGVRVHYPVGEGADLMAKRYAEVVRDVADEDRVGRLRGSRARGIDGRVPVRDEAQIAFAEAIDIVARLTAIDNAVLVDTDLRLRGFGGQVIEGAAPEMTFEHVDPYSGSRHVDDLSTFKGTRHPAGVVFCMRQPAAAAAIIASQDGRLSLATRRGGGKVDVLGSYERGFGWR